MHLHTYVCNARTDLNVAHNQLNHGDNETSGGKVGLM